MAASGATIQTGHKSAGSGGWSWRLASSLQASRTAWKLRVGAGSRSIRGGTGAGWAPSHADV